MLRTAPAILCSTVLALATMLTACGSTPNNPTGGSGPGGGGTGGTGGTGGSVTTSSSGGTGGTGGSVTTSGTGGSTGGSTPGDSGAQAWDFVSAGGKAKSANYEMVFTLGQSTQNQGTTKSANYRMQGGLIGATGSLD